MSLSNQWLWKPIVLILSLWAGVTEGCPRSFSQLTQSIPKELPQYINRSHSRFKINTQAQIVSFPEVEPLEIKEIDPSIQQLFLTVSYRRSGQTLSFNQFYWLFLVDTPRNWKLVMAFSRVGNAPPIDVSEGAMADAVRTWLRDKCRN